MNTYNVLKVNNIEPAQGSPGFYYALPRNAVSIDIIVTKTRHISGPYAKYASKYLGIKNVPETNSVSFSITDVKMNAYSEPDPEQYYFVDLSKYKSSQRNSLLLRFSESGLLQDINDNSEDRVMEEQRQQMEKTEIDYSETFKYFTGANLKEQIDTIVEKLNVDTMTIEKRIVRRSMVEKTLEEKAREAADFITVIKDQRLDIITGAQEVAYSDATIRLMNDELLKLEKEYMMLFMGITETYTYQYRYTYIPESHIYNALIPLFKFSKYTGVVDDEFQGGQMVYIKVSRGKNTMALNEFITANNQKIETTNGFFYRIPEYAKFSILNGVEQIAEASFLISQFGVVTSLPAGNVNVQLYPNTGAIRKVELK
ncbi:MAG: DUF4831 family protein [Bacteroidales bacterium]|nr:DUF4831 family protein [Bacteroidales bacterium]